MQNTAKKSFCFWKETFIQCMALEAFILEVMRTNIKNKEKQIKKNKGKCLYSCSGMSVWAPSILRVNTGKIFVGCQRQRNKSQVFQSRDNFRTKQTSAELIQINPDKSCDPSLCLCMTFPQKSLTKVKAFCQGMKWNRADQLQDWASSLPT